MAGRNTNIQNNNNNDNNDNNNNNNNNGTNIISKKDKKSGKREIKSEGLHPVYQMTEDQFE